MYGPATQQVRHYTHRICSAKMCFLKSRLANFQCCLKTVTVVVYRPFCRASVIYFTMLYIDTIFIIPSIDPPYKYKMKMYRFNKNKPCGV